MNLCQMLLSSSHIKKKMLFHSIFSSLKRKKLNWFLMKFRRYSGCSIIQLAIVRCIIKSYSYVYCFVGITSLCRLMILARFITIFLAKYYYYIGTVKHENSNLIFLTKSCLRLEFNLIRNSKRPHPHPSYMSLFIIQIQRNHKPVKRM